MHLLGKILSVLVVLILFTVYISNTDQTYAPPAIQKTAVAAPPPVIPNDEAPVLFWNTYLHQPIDMELMRQHSSTYRIKEIRERFDVLREQAEARYGKIIVLGLSTGRNTSCLSAMAGCMIEEQGHPTVSLSIGTLMKAHFEFVYKNDTRANERLEVMAAIAVMHEMEHLANGDATAGNPEIPFDKRIECEKRAWANTCRYVIDPLVKKYNAPLTVPDIAFYNDWLSCHGDETSKEWDTIMRERHKAAR